MKWNIKGMVVIKYVFANINYCCKDEKVKQEYISYLFYINSCSYQYVNQVLILCLFCVFTIKAFWTSGQEIQLSILSPLLPWDAERCNCQEFVRSKHIISSGAVVAPSGIFVKCLKSADHVSLWCFFPHGLVERSKCWTSEQGDFICIDLGSSFRSFIFQKCKACKCSFISHSKAE